MSVYLEVDILVKTVKIKKRPIVSIRAKRKPFTQGDLDVLLFWYTVYNGNYGQTTKKFNEVTGQNRSYKVILEVTKRHNFATLAHVMRDQVNKRFYESDTPGMGRILKLSADLMDIDEDLIRHCKRYLMGDSKSKIENVSELIRVLNSRR